MSDRVLLLLLLLLLLACCCCSCYCCYCCLVLVLSTNDIVAHSEPVRTRTVAAGRQISPSSPCGAPHFQVCGVSVLWDSSRSILCFCQQVSQRVCMLQRVRKFIDKQTGREVWYDMTRCCMVWHGMVRYRRVCRVWVAYLRLLRFWMQKVLGSDVLAHTERFAAHIEAQTCDGGHRADFCFGVRGLVLSF